MAKPTAAEKLSASVEKLAAEYAAAQAKARLNAEVSREAGEKGATNEK